MDASARAERIEIRATLELKARLEKAAQLHDQTLSAFVLEKFSAIDLAADCRTRFGRSRTYPRLFIGVRSVRAELVEALSCRKNPFDRLRVNGRMNNPGLLF